MCSTLCGSLPPSLHPSHMQACAALCQRRWSPSRDLPQRSLHGLCYAVCCCACSHWLTGRGAGNVLSLMTKIFGGSIKTLAGSELFALEGCAVLANGRVPLLGSNMITILPRLISFDQNDYPKQRIGPEAGQTRQPFGPIKCFGIVVCLVLQCSLVGQHRQMRLSNS